MPLWTMHEFNMIILLACCINPTLAILSSIEDSFQKKGPVNCLVIAYSKIQHNLYDLSQLTIPLVVIDNFNNAIGLDVASQECKNHIFLLNSLEDTKFIDSELLDQSTGKFAFIVENTNVEMIKHYLLSDSELFQNMIDIVIVLPREGTVLYE